MKKIINLSNKTFKTKIIIKRNYFESYLNNLEKNEKKIYFLVDNKVKYLVKNLLKKKKFKFIFVKSGEQIKNIEYYYNISQKLLSYKIDRDSILVSIGGGTLGDLGGFVASTILRGLEYRMIPTTLLSQVDSSIGGKNGINTDYGKNLIGTFYHPQEVLIDTEILKSLKIREIKAGYAEIVKHSLIKNINFFSWLEENYKKIFKLNSSILEEAIYKSLLIKAWYVKNDTNENLINNKSRAMLNFGHTIGHALETFYQYKKKLNHGEAISIGMIIESKISNGLGFLNDNQLKRIIKHFKDANLKIKDTNLSNKKIVDIILKDKKNLNNKINIVLLKKIGTSFFYRNINIKKINKYLNNN